jgi:hypothetical protein
MKVNIKIKLAALWIVVMFFFLYADILSIFHPGAIDEILSGLIVGIPIDQVSMLSATILMAIPSIMVFLSLTLNAKANRWTNIVVGIAYTFLGVSEIIEQTADPWAYRILMPLLRVVFSALIVWLAWKWPEQPDLPK